jgi:N-acylneuraminate cytidylyltransferase
VPGDFNPHWQFELDPEGRLKIFTGEDLKQIIRRRQDLPKTYFRNGAIYAFRTDLLFLPEPNFYGEDSRAYIMENKYNININSLEDFTTAEMRIKDLG